jgi:type II secretory pathway pseudopilin PulG
MLAGIVAGVEVKMKSISNQRSLFIGRVKTNKLQSSGITLVELLVGMAVTAITLPLLLNLMLEPLLAQLRAGALSEAAGNARLLALRARQSSTVTWDAASSTLQLDDEPVALPSGCSITGSDGNLSVRCSSGTTDAVRHSSELPLITRNPCGGSDLFPEQLPEHLKNRCNEGLGG